MSLSRPSFLLDLLEPASQAIHWGFQELHTQTGLPWYLTIPLGATVIRTCWLPIQYLTQRARRPRETAMQLTSAWRNAYQETARIKFPQGREADAKKAEAWVVEQLKARRKAIQEHNKYLPSWVEPVLAVSFIPLWVLSMNCVRRMAGDERDIVSLIYGFFGRATSNIDTQLGHIEPGFDTESLFWIPSLVSGDPLYILPMAYGTLSTFSVWLRVKDALRRPSPAMADPKRERWALFSKTLSYGLLAMPAFFTFAIIRTDMATALVLYLITITGTQLVQRPLLARLLGTNKRMPPLRARMAKLKGEK
ncbi:hypothetical protein A1O7_06438 [Cladophialophora yegresii CBS 114405]|uniref:Preprotein translocase subunit YidC n=1 Tax=Cladophialophora yegresii CBS 114405 TaxID=1182544 RepID=W9VTF0_9EURO|nr:uncharacterized protein A1O7_06438 [Cladophialophora yegresii CBS 114405]EXJ59007.1 hypothetical protein A1O7_06438 [Cladophialophora yegresii CBS 114405]